MRALSRSHALLLTLCALSLSACSRNPVSPQAAVTSGATGAARAGTRIEDPPAPIVGEAGATVALSVAADSAGTLQAGRWSLKIHKNSLKSDAVITLTVASPRSMEVTVEVTPPQANDFRVPIELTADCSDLDAATFADQTMFWWRDGWTQADRVVTPAGTQLLRARGAVVASARVDGRASWGANRADQ